MAWGDIVQSASAQANGATSMSLATASGVTAGNTVVIALFHRAGTTTLTIVSDPGFVTDLAQPVEAGNASARRHTQVWSWQPGTGGRTSFNLSFSAAVTAVAAVIEFEGKLTLDSNGGTPVRATNSSGAGQANSLSTGTTPSTTQAQAYILTVMGIRHGEPGAVSWTNSLVNRINHASGAQDVDAFMQVASKLVAATGTQTSTASWTVSEESSNAILAYIDPTAAQPETVDVAAVLPQLTAEVATDSVSDTTVDATLPELTAEATIVEAGLAFPTNITAVAQSESSILVDWDPVAEADAYSVERDGLVVAHLITATQFLDTGLDPATEYDYRVRSARRV